MSAMPPPAASFVTLGTPRAHWESLACYLVLQLAFMPFQVWRLYQETALAWLLIDLLGQAVTIVLLFAFPSGREAVLRRERLQVPVPDALRWIIGTVSIGLLIGWVVPPLFAWIPDFALGTYPAPAGWLFALHLAFGLPLAAWLEEIVYRRLAFGALAPLLGSESARILLSAVIFGAIHWWTGIYNVIGTLLAGILFMLCYRRTGALWPAVAAHFILNLFWFGLA
jgi:membrane protease YdiL (CAAX protease family)